MQLFEVIHTNTKIYDRATVTVQLTAVIDGKETLINYEWECKTRNINLPSLSLVLQTEVLIILRTTRNFAREANEGRMFQQN